MAKRKNKILNTTSDKICVLNPLYLEGNVADVISFLERIMDSYRSEGYHSFTLECYTTEGVKNTWLYGSKGAGPDARNST